MRIAIMQPYFLPYAGYFRLMCDVDVFVELDDVQFPRQGWVHRNRLVRDGGALGWLTLPLERRSLGTTIRQSALHAGAGQAWPQRVRAFPAARWAMAQAGPVGELLALDSKSLSHNLSRSLRTCADLLGFDTPFVRSSEIPIDASLKGAERLIAICRQLGATRYVNAPGGRALYAGDGFARAGIRLDFLPDYRGNMASILQRLFESPPQAIRQEIIDNLH